jgi:hypothetical protein
MKVLLLTILFLGLAPALLSVMAQGPGRSRQGLILIKPSVELVDHFGTLNSEERSSRFDSLFQQILQKTGSVGYVFLYCGKQCRYGEIEAHQRGIEVKIALRGFDRSRIVVLNAGFREKFETELWLAPDNELAPRPKSTLNIRYIDFAKASRLTREHYDCCDDYSDVWQNIKP